jgi:hypothetical protein
VVAAAVHLQKLVVLGVVQQAAHPAVLCSLLLLALQQQALCSILNQQLEAA